MLRVCVFVQIRLSATGVLSVCVLVQILSVCVFVQIRLSATGVLSVCVLVQILSVCVFVQICDDLLPGQQ
jgi:uncharacterized membrane protein